MESMNKEQMLEVLERYDALLYVSASPVRESDGGTRFQHLRWMCQEIPKIIAEDKMDKANRWLGFLQGGLWATNLKTIDEMRDDNR